MKIKAVVFDMDGLMIDSERIIQRSWGIAGRRMGFERLEDDIYNILGINRRGREQYFKGKYGQDFPFERFLEDYRKEYALYAEEHGIPAKKGLYELLDTLKDLGIPMALATSSGRQSAMRNLERLGVTGYFSGYVCGDMVTNSKPDPEIYLKACASIQADPAETAALEDSVIGIKSAYAAGMIPVMVPDLVKDIREVEPLLAARKEDLLEVAQWIRNQV